MNKNNRHQLIKDIITENRVSTHKEIQTHLLKHGINVTQTTLSRDLRELGLVKVRDNNETFYALPVVHEEESLGEVLSPYVNKVERASFVLVIHTRLGEAAIVSNIIDAEKPKQILGTLAGADTLIIICRDELAAQDIEKELS